MDGYVLLRGIGQALLARCLISHASSALNRKGRLRAAQWNRQDPSGKGFQKPLQQCTQQKGRVTCCSVELARPFRQWVSYATPAAH
jgi:hypothetical protein